MGKMRHVVQFAALGFGFGMLLFIVDQLNIYVLTSGILGPLQYPPVVAEILSGLLPGLAIASAVSVGFVLLRKKESNQRYVLYMFLSAMGSLLDYAIQLVLFRQTPLPFFAGHLIANLIGVFVMILAFDWYMQRLSIRNMLLLIGIGTFLTIFPFFPFIPAIPYLFLLSFLNPVILAGALGWVAVTDEKVRK